MRGRAIPEGAKYSEMPAFGWGRILSVPWIEEKYATVLLPKRWRLFVAWGKYGRAQTGVLMPSPYKFRWWLLKETTNVNH